MLIMANPIYNQFGNQPMDDGGLSQLIQDARDFKQNFKGNPRQEVERLMRSGQMSQADFNRLSQMANRIVGLMK